MIGSKKSSIIVVAAALIALLVYRFGMLDHAEQTRPVATDKVARVPGGTPFTVETAPSRPEPSGATHSEQRSIDTDALLAALASSDESVRNHAVESMFAQFVEQDPTAARRVLETVGASSQRTRMLQILGIALTRADRRDALSWAAAIPDTGEREDATTIVLTEIATTAPSEAVRLRQDSQLAADDPVLENLVQRWAEQDLSAALQWADSLPPGAQRDRVHARAAYIQSQTSPESAASLIVDRMSSGPAQEEALVSVLHQWAKLDLVAAERWIEKLPAGALQVRAIAELNASTQSR